MKSEPPRPVPCSAHSASRIPYLLPRRAFTLIELLVVIAIIGIFAALLLPNLQRAKGMAILAICQGQIRQAGLACTSYANDADGAFPYGWGQLRGGSVPGYQYDTVGVPASLPAAGPAGILESFRYVDNGAVLNCPAKVGPVPETPGFVYYNYWRVTMYNGWSTQETGDMRASYCYVGYFGKNGDALDTAPTYQPFTGESWYTGSGNGGVGYNVTTFGRQADTPFFIPNWTGRSGNHGMSMAHPQGNPPVLSCPFWQPYYTWSMGAWPHFPNWTLTPANTQWDQRLAGDPGKRNYWFRDGSVRTRGRPAILF